MWASFYIFALIRKNVLTTVQNEYLNLKPRKVTIQDLLNSYSAHPQVKMMESLLKDKQMKNIAAKGLNGSSSAMLIASLSERDKGRFLCILNDLEDAGYYLSLIHI